MRQLLILCVVMFAVTAILLCWSYSMPEKSHRYFVSYTYFYDQGQGYGNIGMTLSQPIRGMDDINAVIDWLKQNVKDPHNVPIDPIILFWKEWEGNPTKEEPNVPTVQ